MGNTTNYKLTEFDLFWIEIEYYLNQKNSINEIDLEENDKDALQKYSKQIYILNSAFKKIQQYELYFSEFYPVSEKISMQDAIEHHFHSYLYDIYTLKEAINKLYGQIKNELIKVNPKDSDIKVRLENLRKKIISTFNQIQTKRDNHQHATNRFIDPNILCSKSIMLIFQKAVQNSKKMQDNPPDDLEHTANLYFEKAKAHWIKNSHDNADTLFDLINKIFSFFESYLYVHLKIKPILRNQNRELKSIRNE